jgi:hypothetical protein
VEPAARLHYSGSAAVFSIGGQGPLDLAELIAKCKEKLGS